MKASRTADLEAPAAGDENSRAEASVVTELRADAHAFSEREPTSSPSSQGSVPSRDLTAVR